MKREDDIKNAVEVMRKGGVILYPTDTVWGIGCDATNEKAVARIYEIKRREDSKAMICLVDSDNRLQRYVRNVPDVAWQLFDCAEDPTTIIGLWVETMNCILGNTSCSLRRIVLCQLGCKCRSTSSIRTTPFACKAFGILGFASAIRAAKSATIAITIL